MKDAMLIVHFIGLAMGLGTSLGFMFLGIAAGKMEKSEALKFSLNTLAMSRMGHIGLALLVISGIYLMTPYWGRLFEIPTLMAKLALVLLLGALIGIISSRGRKARETNSEEALAKIQPIGKISLLTALAIVILAVLTFH